MNTIDSIAPSVEILKSSKVPYALLHCTNVYPTPPSLVRLGAIIKIKDPKEYIQKLLFHSKINLFKKYIN